MRELPEKRTKPRANKSSQMTGSSVKIIINAEVENERLSLEDLN